MESHWVFLVLITGLILIVYFCVLNKDETYLPIDIIVPIENDTITEYPLGEFLPTVGEEPTHGEYLLEQDLD